MRLAIVKTVVDAAYNPNGPLRLNMPRSSISGLPD